MKLYYFLIFIVISNLSCKEDKPEQSLSFLRTSGHDIINESGQKVFLKGVGLGNWMLPEGYMWKFGPSGDRPRKIEKVVEDLIGTEKAGIFWNNFRKYYITEADIKRIAELGFNSVRPALNSRLFVTEDENPVYIDEGFILMDSLVTWCKRHKIYIIIDIHGAPGGQTGANIDDSPNDLPELFTDINNQDKLVELWLRLAQRYKDEPVVAAYNLINEPLPVVTGAAEKYKHLLIPLYERLITEIRKVDPRHMITIEGYDWSNNWSYFSKPLADNIFYQFHYYCWDRPDHLKSIDYFLKKRDTLNTPVWVGETGEKGNTIYWGTAQYFEANNIGFSFWPWKKMDTKNTPYSISKPENWDLIAAYTNNGPKPDSTIAEKAFNQLIENIKLENCVFFEDVCNAIFNRVPGKIEAENYGHKGYNISYFVSDTSYKSAFYRIHEPVNILVKEETKENHLSEQFIELKENEWVQFDFGSTISKSYQLEIMAASVNDKAEIEIEVNGEKKLIRANSREWAPVRAGDFLLNETDNKLKIKAGKNPVRIDWCLFK